jgi:hypothetical protein
MIMKKFVFVQLWAIVFFALTANAAINPEEIIENDPDIQYLVRIRVDLDEIPPTAKYQGVKIDKYKIVCYLQKKNASGALAVKSITIDNREGGIHEVIDIKFKGLDDSKLKKIDKCTCSFAGRAGNKVVVFSSGTQIDGIYGIEYPVSALDGTFRN